jgi:hypothetical protein
MVLQVIHLGEVNLNPAVAGLKMAHLSKITNEAARKLLSLTLNLRPLN